jgi:hypothetical protein
MERRQIGVVKELFRYPVKSMLGERLSEVDIGDNGVFAAIGAPGQVRVGDPVVLVL